MSEFFSMDGDGPYVWAAYGITLAVLIWNIWSARARLRRNQRQILSDSARDEAPRQPKVTQL